MGMKFLSCTEVEVHVLKDVVQPPTLCGTLMCFLKRGDLTLCSSPKQNKEQQKGMRKLSGVMDGFLTLIVAMVSQVYPSVQAHQLLYTKMCSFAY